MTDDPGRVNLTCPCGQDHTVVWPPRNPEAVEIQCTPPCERSLKVMRDGRFEVAER